MTQIRILDFMQSCLAELRAQLGIAIVIAGDLKFDKEFIDPALWARAVYALRRWAPNEVVGALCDSYAEAEITPGNFVGLFAAYALQGCADKEHLSGCATTIQRVRYMIADFFSVLDGGELSGQEPGGTPDLLETLYLTVGPENPGSPNRWADLMLQPELVAIVSGIIEGLQPKHSKAVLCTAHTLVTNLPQKMDPEGFQKILEMARAMTQGLFDG